MDFEGKTNFEALENFLQKVKGWFISDNYGCERIKSNMSKKEWESIAKMKKDELERTKADKDNSFVVEKREIMESKIKQRIEKSNVREVENGVELMNEAANKHK